MTNRYEYSLPPALAQQAADIAAEWAAGGKIARLWRRDASLWTNSGEDRWLGWLTIVEEMKDQLPALRSFALEVRQEGFTHALLLGMGGSSLCPEVLTLTFGRQDGFPELLVLDSTDPVQVKSLEDRIDPKRTLFLVASKSGSTLEPSIFKKYFFDRVPNAAQFAAITDPGSNLEKEARADGFRWIFSGVPAIGGRYSALSNFGMVPAAAMGLDVDRLLAAAGEMVAACREESADNPGVSLGALMGAAAGAGRDKVTFVASPRISDLGAWLEQLIAESTGKVGKAIIPVDREPFAPPAAYGADRLFVYLRFDVEPDPAQEAFVAGLRAAGQPLVTIHMSDPVTIGQEFFRWEIATAVAGAVMGINPFDQPDVEASKIETRKLTTAFEQTGALPADEPYTLTPEFTAALRGQLDTLAPGDYFALLAYIPMTAEHEAALQRIRETVLLKKGVATCLGFGPRFLHSTGQAYKGGPNTGVFVQITCEDGIDLPVPGQKYSFGVVKAAQARGDFAVLEERRRRALRVHLPADVTAGLQQLAAAVDEALGA
jgi:transaldolase / glucose-6-phosphate isomerase